MISVNENSYDSSEDDEDNYKKICILKQNEIFSDLFILLHKIERGDLQSKDFHNNSGSIRFKIDVIKKKILKLQKFNVPNDIQKEQIKCIKESIDKKFSILKNHKMLIEEELTKFNFL